MIYKLDYSYLENEKIDYSGTLSNKVEIIINKIKNNNCVINREYYKNSYKNFKKGKKCDIMKICKKIQGGIWKCAWV